jgi:glycosidase
VAKGLLPARTLLGRFGGDPMGHYRARGRHVSVIDDHDHVCGDKMRFGADAASDHQAAAAVAFLYFTPGTPCLYMGLEQGLGGPEASQRKYLPGKWLRWGQADAYLREAMFGPVHPRGPDAASLHGPDLGLPGFGPFGTCGHHCFDPQNPTYRRIAELSRVRRNHPVLRSGQFYQREVALHGGPFVLDHRGGELAAWSRIQGGVEALVVVNCHGKQGRSGDVVVSRRLTPPDGKLVVVANTAAVAGGYAGAHPVGERLAVHQRPGGPAFVSLRDVPPSEVVILLNQAGEGG